MSTPSRIPVASPLFTDEEAKAVYDCMKSGWITMGPNVQRFESEFAKYVGSKHAVAMCNGTATLHVALASLGIGPGDEVIVPTLTYISTANVVLYQGAKLVLCECDPLTFNIRREDLEKVITSRTKAVISVDMNGLPVDYDDILNLLKEYNIPLVSDSAESLGALYKSRNIGSQADIHSFSFFGNKNVTTGEGGMLTTNNDKFAELFRILRNQGQSSRYNHTHLGFNYRMTDLQAAVGRIQLSTLNDRVKLKNNIVSLYNSQFSSCEMISIPFIPQYVEQHAWYMYTISFNQAVNRDAVISILEEDGIETRTSFYPVHVQPYYSGKYSFQPNDFPISLKAWSSLLNLPISPDLTPLQIDYIIKSTINAASKSLK